MGIFMGVLILIASLFIVFGTTVGLLAVGFFILYYIANN